MTKEQAHILLVEDDPATQALLSAFLREAGYSVSGAATAEAMRQAMARASVDLILLDLNFTGWGWIQLAHSVRNSRGAHYHGDSLRPAAPTALPT